MSQTVDNRIVEMEFDNAEFERGISTSIASLERLKESLNFEGAVKGFDALANFETSGKEGFENLKKGTEKVQASFSAMQIVGYTAIQELTKGIIGLGARFLNFLAGPLAQIEAGGKKRAQNIEQARFQMQGLGLDVEMAMRNAMDAVDGTAYSLDAAAKAAGQLAASGIQLGDDMTTSLRGISGVAAMTNSQFEEIAPIFTTVAGQGKLMTMQLRQLENRGINAAATMAKAFGTTEAAVREMVTDGEVSFEMFSKAMSDAFGDQAKRANDTYAGSLMNVQAALSRIGAKFYAPYYENMRQTLNELRVVINAVNAGLDPLFQFTERIMILSRTLAVNKLSSLDFSGMAESLTRILIPTIDILVNITSGLKEIFNAIGTAWRNVFPPATVTPVVHLLEYIAKLTTGFGLSDENLKRLSKSMEGFFSIIKVGVGGLTLLLKGLGSVVSVVSGFVGPIATPFLVLAGAIGDFVSNVVKLLSAGVKPMDAFTLAFDSLSHKISIAAPTFEKAGSAVNTALDGISKAVLFVAEVLKNVDLDFRPLTVFAGEVDGSLEPFANQNGNVFDRAAEGVRTGLTNFKNAFTVVDSKFSGFVQGITDGFAGAFEALGNAVEAVKPALETGGKVISYFFNLIREAFEGVNVIDIVNTGFFAGLVIVIRNFLKPIKDFSTGVVDLMDATRGALEAYQKQLMPNILLAIGAAVLMLAGAFFIMAQVPKDKIVNTLAGVSVLLVELTASLLLLSHKVGDKSITKLAFSMTILSTAVLILAKAVTVLGDLDIKQAAIGVAGISALLWELVAISIVLKKAEADMVKGSTSLLFFSSSLYIMAFAVKNLGSMDIETLKTGLLSIAGLIAMLGLFMKSTEKSMAQMPAFAAGLLLMAAALNLLVLPLLLLGKIPWQILAQGLTVITATLTIVAFAANAMQSVAAQMTKLGAGLLLLAVALNLLVAPLLILSVIPLEVLGKGLLMLTALLAILSVSAMVMGPIQGQLIAVAAGLSLLAIAVNLLLIPLVTLGAMPFDNIVTGLTALAGLFLVLGVTAVALAPISGGLLVVAGGLALIGLAANLAGAGFFLLAAGISALGLSLSGVATVLPIFLDALGQLMDQLIKSVEVVIISIVDSIGRIMAGIAKALLQVLIDISPKLFETLGFLLQGLIDLIALYGPKLIDLAMNLVMDFIHGIENRSDDLIEAALGIIENLLKGLADGFPGMAEAGADAIIAFLESISEQSLRIADAAFETAITFITGLTDTLTTRGPELSTAMSELAGAMLQTFVDVLFAPAKGVFSTGQNIVTGVIDGIKDKFGALKEAATNAGSWILDALNGRLDINSPSKEGEASGSFFIDGVANGIRQNGKAVSAADLSGQSLLDAFKQKLDKISPLSQKAGEDAGKSLGTGITNGSKHSTDAARKAAEEALKAIHETFATISVSEGKYMVDGIVIGMVSKMPNMYEASKFLAQAIQKGLIEEASQFTGVGDTEATAFLEGMTDDEIIAKAWDAGVKVSSSAWEGAKDTAEAMEAAGKAAGQAYIDGLNAAAEKARKLAEDIANKAASGGFARANKQRRQDLEDGRVFTDFEESQMTDEEAKKYWEHGGGVGGKIAVDEMRGVGEDASDGLAEGISDGLKTVTDAIKKVTDSVVDAAKDALDIHSPSGVFSEIGVFSGLGFVNGLKSMASRIRGESKNLGQSALDGLNSAISKVVDVIDGDIDYAPVIRPVLDLDSVQNGMKDIADILNQDNEIAAKIADRKNTPGVNSEKQNSDEQNQGKTYQFTQNNYSPKPLSRIDIYRQTKNQFSTMKGLVEGQ